MRQGKHFLQSIRINYQKMIITGYSSLSAAEMTNSRLGRLRINAPARARLIIVFIFRASRKRRRRGLIFTYCAPCARIFNNCVQRRRYNENAKIAATRRRRWRKVGPEATRRKSRWEIVAIVRVRAETSLWARWCRAIVHFCASALTRLLSFRG